MTEKKLTKEEINLILKCLNEINIRDSKVLDLRERLYEIKRDMYK
tara:strand:+ start:7994 stop:8128 length:135 start_codon:yes stop_codon:yes gene_type:complete